MKFNMLAPCHNCPFLKKGGIRLTQERVREIAGYMLDSQGGTFPCHKTVDYDAQENDDGENPSHRSDQLHCHVRDTSEENHCAGALIFALHNDNMTQMMRITQRLGQFNPSNIMGDPAITNKVFETLQEMEQVNQQENWIEGI